MTLLSFILAGLFTTKVVLRLVFVVARSYFYVSARIFVSRGDSFDISCSQSTTDCRVDDIVPPIIMRI